MGSWAWWEGWVGWDYRGISVMVGAVVVATVIVRTVAMVITTQLRSVTFQKMVKSYRYENK